MAQLIQIIDKRIAKFSSKNSPLKPIVSTKDTRNVKLKPIEILNLTKPKGEPSQTTKVRRVKLQASNILKSEDLNEEVTVELSNNSNFHDYSNFPESVEEVENIEKLGILEKTAKEERFEERTESEELQQEESKETGDLTEPMETVNDLQEEIREREMMARAKEVADCWTRIARRLAFVPFKEKYNWVLYLVWRKKIGRGVRVMAEKWRKKVKSVEVIQKSWRMAKVRKEFLKTKAAAVVIQRYWHMTRPLTRNWRKVRNLVKVLGPLYRLRFYKRNQAAVKIQKVFKGRKVYKTYQPLIAQKLEIRKHQMMLARQATLKKTRNLKKTAAKLIEDEWLSYQNRKKLKDVRKYLWTLPYECRILYFKFQQVKKDADNLKNDVDQLIAKKQGKLST